MEWGTIEAVKAGEQITVTFPGSQPRKETITVKPACENKTEGQWYCATCDEAFQNNLQKDIHCDAPGVHRLAWNCRLHGLEAP